MDREREFAVAAWLRTHDGIISREQARRLGVTPCQLQRLLAQGAWVRVFRGVYRVASHPEDAISTLRAAILAAGAGAHASHLSAAWLHHMADTAPAQPTLTIPQSRTANVPGITVTRRSHPCRPEHRRGLPCSPPALTLLECASVLDDPCQLDALIDAAVAHRTVRLDTLQKDADRATYHRGRPALLGRLATRGVTGSPHPSVLESRFARLLRKQGLPVPKAEVMWGPNQRYRLDFAYPKWRLVVEVNGWSYHSTPEQVRRDTRRRNELNRGGWTVLEFDWWDVTYSADRVLAEVIATIESLQAA